MPPLGIMFHHFHDDRHPAGDGSLSADELAALIEHLGPGRILPAAQWLERAANGELGDDLCLTFDDTLRWQYDVALPVLADFGLTAFWFVTGQVLAGEISRLEVYRTFRILCYDTTTDFYQDFYRLLACSPYAEEVARALVAFQPDSYLSEFPFYSEADRRFRFVRDRVLGRVRYEHLMDTLIATRGLSLAELADELWLTPQQVHRLHTEGHVIGLHSYTHPTALAELPPDEQRREYERNSTVIRNITGQAPRCVSHPCNSYSHQTLQILREMGIVVGFRADMAARRFGPLEYPRQDHANIMREMRACGSQSSPATSLVTSP